MVSGCRGKRITIAKQRSLKSLIQEACGQVGADPITKVQPLQSEMVKIMPRYQRIPDARTANLLAEAGVVVEQYLLAGNYVCVSQGTRYLLNQSRIPAKLKKPISNYQLWHLESSGCNYDDFDAHRRQPNTLDEPAFDEGFAAEQVLVVELGGRDMVKRVLQSATLLNPQLGLKEATVSFVKGARGYAACDFDISVFEQQLLGRKYREVWQQLTAHAITSSEDAASGNTTVTNKESVAQHKIRSPIPDDDDNDMRREYAYYTTERSQLTKLSAKDADMLGDAMVTVLTETTIRGRAGVYAEYIFSLPNGVMRRLSAKEKMTVNVKQLVEDYECWHLEAVGAYSYDWIQQQDDYPGSDAEENADQFGSRGYKEEVLREELDEESEPEDLDDLQTCDMQVLC